MKTTEKDIEDGYKILSNIFDNNPFAELKALREAVFALYIKQDINATQEQKDWAEAKIQEMLALNDSINQLRNN